MNKNTAGNRVYFSGKYQEQALINRITHKSRIARQKEAQEAELKRIAGIRAKGLTVKTILRKGK